VGGSTTKKIEKAHVSKNSISAWGGRAQHWGREKRLVNWGGEESEGQARDAANLGMGVV